MSDLLNRNESTEPAPSTQTTNPPLSDRRLAANRANAQKSTGPRTEADRLRSSLNAYKNGATAQTIIGTPEDLALYEAHLAQILTEHAPASPTEHFLAVSMADCMWRLLHIRSLESGIFAQGFRAHVDSIHAGHPQVDAALAAAETFLQQAHQFNLLTIYEGRVRRTLEKDMKALGDIQSERKAAHDHARNEAELLVEHAEAKGETYDPADDFTPAAAHGGFVFSTAGMARYRNREQRLNEARSFHIGAKHRQPKPETRPAQANIMPAMAG
ncbi:MAG TPA: hypothetical protein VHW24_09805 [Bryobacteraceae bacterium]|nr:hypothetical protein [Bryobacteraceae bacterium]